MPRALPLLYGELAEWYPLLAPTQEYEAEAAAYREILSGVARTRPRRLLELGAGAGGNAFYLKRDFQCTLTDLSPAMLELSRRVNPECEHIEGDMRSLRLAREFDAVFAHDALGYLHSESELRQTIETAFAHCRPGGIALFAPDFVRESFRAGEAHGGSDGAGRALRYLEWCWDCDPSDHHYWVEYAFLLREGEQVRAVHDRHLESCFPRATWRALLAESGFLPHPTTHAPCPDPLGELLAGVRPL